MNVRTLKPLTLCEGSEKMYEDRLVKAGLDWPLCHCAVAQAPPFDKHRRPLAPSKFFDNNGNNFS